MSFEDLSSARVRLQHCLDPLAQVRVLATPLGEVRGSLLGREFAGGIENFLFGPSVQTPEQMYADMEGRLMLLHELADRLYSRWIEGLRLLD